VINDEWLEKHGQAHGLTLRESQVIALITQGQTNQEIAEGTYLSINSVKTYIRSAYRKIGVSRRSQAVVWGLTNGFVPQGGDAGDPHPVDQDS
jgi:NarL family two-component system response regulator LiaR